jgi:hypothetical protein
MQPLSKCLEIRRLKPPFLGVLYQYTLLAYHYSGIAKI